MVNINTLNVGSLTIVTSGNEGGGEEEETSYTWKDAVYTDDWVFSDGVSRTVTMENGGMTVQGMDSSGIPWANDVNGDDISETVWMYSNYDDSIESKCITIGWFDANSEEDENGIKQIIGGCRIYTPAHWEDAAGNWVQGSWSEWKYASGNEIKSGWKIVWQDTPSAGWYSEAGDMVDWEGQGKNAVVINLKQTIDSGSQYSEYYCTRTWTNTVAHT